MSTVDHDIFDPALRRIADSAQEEASKHISGSHSPAYAYHDLSHTQRIVRAAVILSDEAHVSEVEKTKIIVAAWFHDSGYYDQIVGHEEVGVRYATEFLKAMDLTEEFITDVVMLIRKTAISSEPENLLQEILRDADLHYLGIPEFRTLAEELRKEWDVTLGRSFTEKEWIEQNLNFFSTHRYYTPQARSHYQHGKDQNFAALQDELAHL